MEEIEDVKVFFEIDKSDAILPRIQKMKTDMHECEKTIKQLSSDQSGTVDDAQKQLVIVQSQLEVTGYGVRSLLYAKFPERPWVVLLSTLLLLSYLSLSLGLSFFRLLCLSGWGRVFIG